MALFKAYRETALPGSPDNDSLYVVAPAATPNYFELYAVNSSGQVRRIPTEADVAAQINAALSATSSTSIVADITARDALTPTTAEQVYVEDASADATVASGGAFYLYDVANTLWVKTSEAESMDVVLEWANIQNKPASSVAAIDAAVANNHAHSNKTELDQLSEDGDGDLAYNGGKVRIEWNEGAAVGW